MEKGDRGWCCGKQHASRTSGKTSSLWTSFGRRFAPKQTFAPCKRKHVLGGDRMQRGVVSLQEEVSE